MNKDDVYDYEREVTNDVIDYITENYEYNDRDDIRNIVEQFDDYDDFVDKLNEECYESDSVTGNASGSYYCNRYDAEESLCHNWDLMKDACDTYGVSVDNNPETIDVCVRCYMLGVAIDNALDALDINPSDWDDEEDEEEEDEEEYYTHPCASCDERFDCPEYTKQLHEESERKLRDYLKK